MGPSTSVDGEKPPAIPDVPSLHGFNGAVDKRRRRDPPIRLQPVSQPRASMGPSTSVDGETRSPACSTTTSLLQWGRRQASTESLRSSHWQERSHPLQWGRRQASTERLCKGSSWETPRGLQWGRRQASTERLGRADVTKVPGRFNGAVDKRRRRDVRRALDGPQPVASMGPSTSVDGEALEHRVDETGIARFNGAVDKRRRRASSPIASPRSSGSFNGAVDKRRRRGVRPLVSPLMKP